MAKGHFFLFTTLATHFSLEVISTLYESSGVGGVWQIAFSKGVHTDISFPARSSALCDPAVMWVAL